MDEDIPSGIMSINPSSPDDEIDMLLASKVVANKFCFFDSTNAVIKSADLIDNTLNESFGSIISGSQPSHIAGPRKFKKSIHMV